MIIPATTSNGRAAALLYADALLLTQAIEAIADYAVTAVPLDVVVYRALGWTVEPRHGRQQRGPLWRAKSPISCTWQPLPRPTRELSDAKRLVPFGWSWGVGRRGAHPYAWVAARTPIVEGVPHQEGGGLSEELALTKVCLFALRQLLLRHEGLIT